MWNKSGHAKSLGSEGGSVNANLCLESTLWVLCANPPGLGLFQANVQVHSFRLEQWSVSVSALATFCEIKQDKIQHYSSSEARISHKLSPSLSLFFQRQRIPLRGQLSLFPAFQTAH